MTTFKQWLYEMSYNEADIPPYFYVVARLNLPELVQGRLVGLQGLSSSKGVFQGHVGYPKVVPMKIPSGDLLKLNRLTRILYDNPNYLVSKNLEPLDRVSYMQINSFLRRVLRYIHGAEYLNLAGFVQDRLKNYNNSGQLAKQIVKILAKRNMKTDYETVKAAIEKVSHETVADYTYEQEWRVKPSWARITNEIKKLPVLILPSTTQIMIITNELGSEEIGNIANSGLLEKYKVFVSREDDLQSFLYGHYTPTTSEELNQIIQQKGAVI